MNKEEKLNYQNFIPLLFKEIPEFKKTASEYSNCKKQLSPEIILGDLTQFIIEECYQFNLTQQQSNSHHQRIRSTLDFLEKGMNSSDSKIHELISVYFLENLLGEEHYEQIREMLGPNLREELRTWE